MINSLDDFYKEIFRLIGKLIEKDEYRFAEKLYSSLNVSQSQFELFGECRNRMRELGELKSKNKIELDVDIDGINHFIKKFFRKSG